VAGTCHIHSAAKCSSQAFSGRVSVSQAALTAALRVAAPLRHDHQEFMLDHVGGEGKAAGRIQRRGQRQRQRHPAGNEPGGLALQRTA
jgi:hypothetical protein